MSLCYLWPNRDRSNIHSWSHSITFNQKSNCATSMIPCQRNHVNETSLKNKWAVASLLLSWLSGVCSVIYSRPMTSTRAHSWSYRTRLCSRDRKGSCWLVHALPEECTYSGAIGVAELRDKDLQGAVTLATTYYNCPFKTPCPPFTNYLPTTPGDLQLSCTDGTTVRVALARSLAPLTTTRCNH